MWVRHICDREFTFGDNTTNRVESHKNLIKKVLKSSSKLHEALANILKLAGMSRQNTCHAATLLKTCNFYSYNTSHDIERQCEKVLTPYACRLVSKQLMKMEESNRAIRKTAEDKYEVASGVGDACHQVCLDSQSCSCTTFSKMGLLCRHFLAVCVKLSTKNDLDKAVHKRWFKNYQMSFVGPCEDVNSEESHCPENVEIVSMPGPSFKKMNRNQRYNFAMQTLKALADTLADCRPEFFQARLRHLEDINAVWLKGDDAGEAGCSEERTTEANCGDHDQCSSEQHDNVPENGSQINHTQNKRKQDVEENDVPIKLPMVKTRGWPTKRLRQRKLKKLRKGGQPMPFLELSSKEQEKLILTSIAGEDVAGRALDGNFQVQESHVEVRPECLPSCVLDCKAPLPKLKKYFTPDAWLALTSAIATKKQGSLWYCGHCKDKYDGALNMICCDQCLEWYHWSCAGVQEEDLGRHWFCPKCSGTA
ncbi:hypothetical protein MRX96_000947 [Rhipicephalus microplus]